MATIPLTKRGAEKLKEELHRLKTVERHAVINAIAEARAQGDLSENAEYDAAKDKQGFIEGRILEIEGKLAAAQIIDPATLDAGGRIVFGSTVDLEDEASGERVTYQIVGEDEADLKLGLVGTCPPGDPCQFEVRAFVPEPVANHPGHQHRMRCQHRRERVRAATEKPQTGRSIRMMNASGPWPTCLRKPGSGTSSHA